MKLEAWQPIDDKAVAISRALAMDAVQKVGNGHPGTAMSLAPVAYTLFQRILKHDPANPNWIARDRFILSCGHSSLTLYIQLFLSGYGVELEDLKQFRTFNSLTPGHPEYGHTVGVETTTGPLGQGVANAGKVASVNTKSIVAGKNDMGGSNKNIARGGSNPAPDGTSAPSADKPKDLIGKVQNTAGGKKSLSPATKPTATQASGVNDKSIVTK